MSDETTLLSCPFCGGEASVKVLEYDDDCKVWGVFCESDLANEYSHGHFVDNYATEAEAIAAWNTRVDYHGYEQAAIEAWESIKAWNSRAERTCHWEYPQSVNGWVGYMVCSSCGEKYDETVTDLANYCPNCGARVVE